MDSDFNMMQELLEKLLDEHGECSLRIFYDGYGYVSNDDEDIIYEFDNEDDLFDLCVKVIHDEDMNDLEED